MTRTTNNEEDLARRVRCPVCHVPAGYPCRTVYGQGGPTRRERGAHPERVREAAENPPHDLSLERDIHGADPPPLTRQELLAELAVLREQLINAGRFVPVNAIKRVRELEARLEEVPDDVRL